MAERRADARRRASSFGVLLLTIVILLSTNPTRTSGQPAEAFPALRLMLYVVVDQFRADYLTRFDAAYTHGLRRLVTDGAVFTNASLDHYPTVTAPGHATLGTGAMVSTSGIIGNDWFDRESGKQVTSVSDDEEQQLGGGGGQGSSPRRLLVSTLADEIKMATRAAGLPPSRAIGVSLKDRGAILTVGHAADAAYWFDIVHGAFVSSTYYFRGLPPWVRAFNASRPLDEYAGKTWPGWSNSLAAPVLPSSTSGDLVSAVTSSPFGNDLLLRFVMQALDMERLGQRGTVDVLSVSFSSNDNVGHAFGPDSPEVRAVSIDTDRVIGRLLDLVDRLVGLDRTLVVFTADHGVAPLPETLPELKLPGGRIANDSLFGPVRQALEARYGQGNWLLGTAGSSLFLNDALMDERGVDPIKARQMVAGVLASLPHVARVYTRDQLLDGRVPSDTYSQRVLRSFSPKRSGDLEVLLEPYWMRQAQGTTHGTPYGYDARIPLVFMGRGLRPGRYEQNVVLNDVAPTLAALLRVTPPSGASGRVLVEMFDDAASAQMTPRNP